jgi:hypothetical protein
MARIKAGDKLMCLTSTSAMFSQFRVYTVVRVYGDHMVSVTRNDGIPYSLTWNDRERSYTSLLLNAAFKVVS